MIREIAENVEVIRQRMKAVDDRQKFYADRRRKELEFSIEDMVFVQVSFLRKVMRCRTSGKLPSRFVGSFPILERVEKLVYRVELPA